MWDLEAGVEKSRLVGHRIGVSSLALSSDNKTLFSGGGGSYRYDGDCEDIDDFIQALEGEELQPVEAMEWDGRIIRQA